jgi:dephospho-CoA kinase/inosine/xanthosine triphosphate pyrophosphatase family protein
MRDLIFFTSNATKLAHARYIAEDWQVRIKGFRQQTYHADYNEPRLPTREALLDASYRSAVVQCLKAGIPTDTTPFFLEDTSVRIDALSSPSKEIPGLDVKFWMQEQDFASLDAALKARGNDRSASVRSDVLLHVPSSLKAAWNIKNEYLVFVGTQTGSIVSEEVNYQPNLVFPWLDNQTFNKWFQPEGSAGPFGALEIARADEVDFRRNSFAKLFSFLAARSYLTGDFEQLEFQLYSKSNLILCGYTCAGKTTASQHLARRFGYLHIEASDFMYLNYLYRHGYSGQVAVGDFAEQALGQKPTIAAEKVAEYIGENPSAPVVVSGFRSPEEIDFLRRTLSPQGKNFDTLFIEADEEARFQRLRGRMRPGDDISLQDFRRRDLQQQRMGLEGIRLSRSVTTLRNGGTLRAYLASVDRTVGAHNPEEIDIRVALAAAARITDIRIEGAILIALLAVWSPDEARPFFTTTQIAGLICSTLPGMAPKHKDNVSRYFNQDFYAYYEINNNPGSTTRRYRLSNTGYGQAVRALRQITRRPLPASGSPPRSTPG